MQLWTQKVLAVQELDLKIAKIAEQLRQTPEKMKEAEQIFLKENAVLDEAKAAQKSLELETRKLETEIESQKGKKREFQTKTAMIKNNDEYRAALLHIETMDQVLKGLEDRQIDLMLKMEEAQALVKEKKQLAEAARKEADAAKKQLTENQTGIEEKALGFLAERKKLAQDVDPELMANYERIRKGRKFPSTRPWVVPVDNGACGRCRLRLTPQNCEDAVNGKVLYCPHCAAILYGE